MEVRKFANSIEANFNWMTTAKKRAKAEAEAQRSSE